MLRSLAAVTTRRPRLSIAVVVLLLVAAIGAATSAGGRYIDDFTVPGIESQQAQDLIEQRFPGQAGDAATVVLTSPVGIRCATPSARSTPRWRRSRASRTSPSVDGPLAPGQVAGDWRTAFATVGLRRDRRRPRRPRRARRLEQATARSRTPGVDVAHVRPGRSTPATSLQRPVGEIAGVLVALRAPARGAALGAGGAGARC